MNKKRALVYLLLAILLIAGTFGPPLAGQRVRAAESSTVAGGNVLVFVASPPAIVCVGDSVPIVFAYLFSAPTHAIGISASAPGGNMSPSTWSIDRKSDSGILTAGYTARREGRRTITLTASGLSVSLSDSVTFDAVECEKELVVGASSRSTGGHGARVDTFLLAKGGLSINFDNGSVTGGGTYEYTHRVRLDGCTPVDPLITNSTFTVLRGGATSGGISFELDFVEYPHDEIRADCSFTDGGVSVSTVLLPAGTIDPDTSLALGMLNFPTGVTHIQHPYGTGWLSIRLLNRK